MIILILVLYYKLRDCIFKVKAISLKLKDQKKTSLVINEQMIDIFFEGKLIKEMVVH